MSVIAAPAPPVPTFERQPLSLPSLQHSFSTSSIPRSRQPVQAHDNPCPHSESIRDDGQRKRTFSAVEPRQDSVSGPVVATSSDEHNRAASKILALSPSPQSGTSAERFPRPSVPPRSPLPRTEGAAYLHPAQSPYQTTQRAFPPSPRTQGAASDPRWSAHPGAGYLPAMTRKTQPGSAYVPPSLVHQKRSSSSAGTPGHFISGSASPSGSYSSYGRDEQTSPNAHDPAAGMQAPSSGMEHMSLSRSPNMGAGQSPTFQQEQSYAAGMLVTGPGGQSTYQLMTVQTANGTVQVPVDVQAASRLADEKRRRNAGASARFRERRKKKEMEASSTIRKLETQVKHLSEDLDFYRRERDYLANVVMQAPGADRHFPRPASPRLRRESSVAASAGDSSDRGYDFVQEQPDSREDGRNVRRRTSSFHGSTDSGPPPGLRTPATAIAAPSQYFTPPSQAPPSGTWPRPEYMSNPAVRPEPPRHPFPPPSRNQLPPLNLPPVMQAAPPTGPQNPYAGHRLDKPWSHGPPPHFPRDPR
ncbi:transcription factor-like protein 20 [Elsinoe australis]|uniref:Transcription factor-like protein 20 n=1 Tax=Elsinoe australis TaxID=40998 RepID=A0A4U7AV37_9PEZI|nr:transcription factor-like protein 20 [Elsinoe australis]